MFEEIIVENISKWGKETDIQVWEAQKKLKRVNLRRSTPRHILIKMSKIKHRDS